MSGTSTTHDFNSGSRWHRWDPHIHAPGTALNDGFGDDWEKYLTKIEAAVPPIHALGITDYLSIEAYRQVRAHKARGRLPNVELIFPNVEMRLDTKTARGTPINLHLLFSPDDTDHEARIIRTLSEFDFEYQSKKYRCERADLIELARRFDASIRDDDAAFSEGVNQFKVSLDQLRGVLRGDPWMQANCIIAVAGGKGDGASGLQHDDAFAATRIEIQRTAHIIFSANPNDREFWIGDGAENIDVLRERYNGPKPCVHGSDAHKIADVGAPDGDRYTWVKGQVAFDTLRQACIDPKGRAFVGPQPPISAIPSQAIASIEIVGASWANPPKVEFNPGLVAIIGARGSGKSALAEMTALGCDSIAEHQSEDSFLYRAADLLSGVSARLLWQSGEPTQRSPDNGQGGGPGDFPRARYLSQQFVDELCATDRGTDALVHEIQRVIYKAHPTGDVDGTSNFDELLELRVAVIREDRLRQEAALAELSQRIGTDREKQTQVSAVRSCAVKKVLLIRRYKADRKKLVSKDSEKRVKRIEDLTRAAEKVKGYLRYFANQKQALLLLEQEVRDHRTRKVAELLRQLKERFQPTGIKEEDWSRFLLEYKGDVDAAIAAYKAENETKTKRWKGTAQVENRDLSVALIGEGVDLAKQSLALLEAEIARLQKLVNVDKATANKFVAVSNRISEETAALTSMKEKLVDYEGAAERLKSAQKDRDAAYAQVFASIGSEEAELLTLYAPLRARLEKGTGAISKLSFSVKRRVDVESWASRGEQLLDLRKLTPFQGRGTLLQLASASLGPAWSLGDSAAVAAAMSAFVAAHLRELPRPSSLPPTEQANYRDWLKRFAKWLYSTDHVLLQYSIDYDGVDIRKLSPGTRGIVLLLLYLALDDADDRPLIIDQPEENLDPKSVYDELVPLFRAAKAKRQVVLVTHNANLVVNTDADQVIVAQAGARAPGQLPPITYTSGGLEEGKIRRLVCDILEGGEEAFRERARRLRVRLER